jgi:Flp pilus assembly protein TadD
VTFLLYLPILSNNFVGYDDPKYVTDNPVVKQGLTPHGVYWAITTGYFGNWLPVTWLSHLAAVSLFGLNPAGHHAFDAVLHACNAALVLVVLKAMTGRRWPSAVVAAVFAVHPLRVESVAWVAEQKDVLAGLFFLLTLLAYTSYARRPSVLRYAAVLVLYALGLMSKTMLVTVPFLLLLLDIWPLNRGRWRVRMLAEKVPLIALAAAACAWTVHLQEQIHAMMGQDIWPIGQRAVNAVVSVPRYLAELFWPAKLSVFYPHPQSWPAWEVAGSAVLILVISTAAWMVRRNMPYVLVGWLWFLGMLVPVCGLVQAGLQSMADRYTYLPSIGLLIALVWTGAELCARTPALRLTMTSLVGLVLAALAVVTWYREPAWKNTRVLFEDALAVEEQNWEAHDWVGSELSAAGDDAAALGHFRRAMELNPRHASPVIHVAGSLRRQAQHDPPGPARQRKLDHAVALFREGVRLQPDVAFTHQWLGIGLTAQGTGRSFAEADAEFAIATRLEPENPSLYVAWALSKAARRRFDDARELIRSALRIDPTNDSATDTMKTINRLEELAAKGRQATRPAGTRPAGSLEP